MSADLAVVEHVLSQSQMVAPFYILRALFSCDISLIFQYFFLKVDEKIQMLEHLAECDVVVYDITEDPDQIDEASWAVSGM